MSHVSGRFVSQFLLSCLVVLYSVIQRYYSLNFITRLAAHQYVWQDMTRLHTNQFKSVNLGKDFNAEVH